MGVSDGGDRGALPGIAPEEDVAPSAQLDCDGEVFELRPDGFGGTQYTWLSGPNPGYGDSFVVVLLLALHGAMIPVVTVNGTWLLPDLVDPGRVRGGASTRAAVRGGVRCVCPFPTPRLARLRQPRPVPDPLRRLSSQR